MEKYEQGTHRLHKDAVITLADYTEIIVPIGTILVVPSETEQASWRKLKAPGVSPKGFKSF